MEKIDYNSPDLEPDQVLANLGLGYRTPQNEFEKDLLKQIREIEDEGFQVGIPPMGIF